MEDSIYDYVKGVIVRLLKLIRPICHCATLTLLFRMIVNEILKQFTYVTGSLKYS